MTDDFTINNSTEALNAMREIFSEFGNGYDAVVEQLVVELDTRRSVMRGQVVLRAAKLIDSVEHWFRLRLSFSQVERVRLAENWLRGGGAVLYDGGMLHWSHATRRGVLNLDPGLAWRTTGQGKAVEDSNALLEGICDISVEPIPAQLAAKSPSK